MAITRAQQVRQMLRDGSIKPVEQAGVMNYMPSEMVTVPKIAKSSPDTPTAKLAYITPKEEDILVDLNLYGSLDGKPNRGPGGIPSLEGDFGPGGRGNYSEAGTGRDVSTDSQGRTVIGGDINQGVDVRAARSAKAEAIKEERERQKNEAIKAAQDLQKQKVIERRKRMGLKLMKEKIPGTQEYLDAEKDDTAAELDLFINDPYREDGTKRTLPTPIGIGLNLLEEPLKAGAKKTREFFTGPTTDIFGRKQKGVLAAGKFNYKGEPLTEERFANMSLTEKNQAYKDYMSQRLGNEIDAYGNPLNTGDDRGQTLPIIPRTIANMTADAADADAEEKENVGRMFRLLADGGMTEDAPVGGIMDIETGRQMYGLGKLVKKATRAVKKIVKSPIGKAALFAGLGSYGLGIGPFSSGKFGAGFLKNPKFLDFMFKGGEPGLFNLTGKGAMAGIAALSALPLLKGQEEDDEEDIDRGPPLEIDRIRANPYTFIPRRFAAEGGSMKEPVAKKTMPLIDMDGKEKDYRETGGFVDMGRMERADDVPARLSKNEFVFTADAVRNAGDGSVDKGAEVMYNMMKNLEAGGDVSEESQGLNGARKMFQTSQRLGEVL